jgi:hypothetical protein
MIASGLMAFLVTGISRSSCCETGRSNPRRVFRVGVSVTVLAPLQILVGDQPD